MAKHPQRCKKCNCGIPDSQLGGLFSLRQKESKVVMTETPKMKISYSAVVLSPESKNLLLQKLGDRIPEGWETIAHHMTVKMGELPPELKDSVGLPVSLKVTAFFSNDLVAAATVLPPGDLEKFVTNKHSHITLGVNHKAGGKPMMSNQMILDQLSSQDKSDIVGSHFTPFSLTGNLEEIPFAAKE